MAQKINPQQIQAQEAWITPTLSNGWAYYAAPFQVQGYMKDTLGFVHIKGLIKSGTTGTTIFTLPVGYRPSNQCMFIGVANNSFCRLDVAVDGTVLLSAYGTGGSNAFVSLDNIIFKAES